MDTQRLAEKLKVELAKVGLQKVHGIPCHDNQRTTIDGYLRTLSSATNESRCLEEAVARLLENTTEDPVRLAGIAMHYCDRLTERKIQSRMIRDASRCSESSELKAFLDVVADEVDRVDSAAISKEVEALVDTLVEVFDEPDHNQEACRQHIEAIYALLPGLPPQSDFSILPS